MTRGFPQHELEVAGRKGSFEDAGWRLRKDGTRFWANVVITAVFDATGQLRGFANITRDLTERERLGTLLDIGLPGMTGYEVASACARCRAWPTPCSWP